MRSSVKPLIHISLYESTVAFIRRCAMQHVEGNQKDDEAEERGGRGARCFLRIRRVSSEQACISGSSGSRDELTTFTFSTIVLQQRAMGASYVRQWKIKKETAIWMVGKTSTGSGTRLVNLPWQFNEDVYKPERNIEKERQKYFRFRPRE